MSLRVLAGRWMEKPNEHSRRLQHCTLRDRQRQLTTSVPGGGKRSANSILSNRDHAVSESFHQQASDLLSQHLAAGSSLVAANASPKVLALDALLGEITKQMATLPLKRRLKFFRSSVAVVAEVLAAMHREAPARSRSARSVRRPQAI